MFIAVIVALLNIGMLQIHMDTIGISWWAIMVAHTQFDSFNSDLIRQTIDC